MASQQEIQKRIKELIPIYLSGRASGLITLEYSEKWGISTRQIEGYLKTVRELCASSFAEDIESILDEYKKLYQEASLDPKHIYQKKFILDSIAKIQVPQKIDHTTNGESISFDIKIINPRNSEENSENSE